jgi:hypothetical protein
VVGLIAARAEPATGGCVTEVHSAGIEIRNLPGYRGLTLGSRSTAYFHPIGTDDPDTEKTSTWGAVHFPDREPVFTRSATHGFDFAWEPSFRGFSCGIDSRSCGILKPDQSAELRVNTISPSSPDRYQYKTTP